MDDHIQKTPGVCGGAACIRQTRIPVWVLEGFRRQGMGDDRLLENYPALRAADLVDAWAYVAAHPQEIDEVIRRNEEA